MKLRIAALLLACLPMHAIAFAPSKADQSFQAIYEKEWKWRQANLGIADEDSDSTGDNDRLPDVSAKAQAQRLLVWEDVLRQLDALDSKQLTADNRINLAIYRAQVENLAAEVRFGSYEMPFNADSSFWSNLAFMARRPMKNLAEYQAYIGRLNVVPRHFEQQIDNMRAGLARGFSVPRAVLDGREVSIANVAGLKDPTTSAYYAPFKQLPANIPAAEQQRLRAEAAVAGHPVLVDDAQIAPAHAARVEIVGEGEAVAALQPAVVGMAALGGGAELDHGELSFCAVMVARPRRLRVAWR